MVVVARCASQFLLNAEVKATPPSPCTRSLLRQTHCHIDHFYHLLGPNLSKSYDHGDTDKCPGFMVMMGMSWILLGSSFKATPQRRLQLIHKLGVADEDFGHKIF